MIHLFIWLIGFVLNFHNECMANNGMSLFSAINLAICAQKPQHQWHKNAAQQHFELTMGTVCCRKQKEAISMEIPLIKLNLKKKWPTIQAKIYLIENTQSGAFIYLFHFFF